MSLNLLSIRYPGQPPYRQGETGMKAVILAGWFGTRISEATQVKPKPMIEIGGKPILWHIIKIYSAYGINGFILMPWL
jgi:NDP-sugar pyrophosphorylase family protein